MLRLSLVSQVKLRKFWIWASLVVLVSTPRAFAEDDVPFDDLESLEDAPAPAPKSSPSTSSPTKKKKSAETPKEAAKAAPAEDGLDDLGDLEAAESKPAASSKKDAAKSAPPAAAADDLGEDLGLDDLGEEAPKAEAAKDAPPADDALDDLGDDSLAADDGKEEKPADTEEGMRDLLTPDDSIKQAEGTKPAPAPIPTPLRDNDVASTLDPSDQFYRIPLRPQMSDANWKKYAGPVIDKDYRIRKGDSLWAISERLFGNPYLWPKVWQLNAQFGNPHQIDPGIVLSFFLGSANSAPTIAMKLKEGGSEFLPLIETYQRLGFLEELEERIKAQAKSPDPPFQNFLVEDIPEEVGRMPEQKSGRILYVEGDQFETDEIQDGEFAVIRTASLNQIGGIKTPFSGYRLKWLGTLKVENKIGRIVRAFAEIETGDSVVTKNFGLQLLSLREDQLGEKEAKRVKIVSVEDGTFSGGGYSDRLMGVRFSSKEAGPTPGAILRLKTPIGRIGTAVLVFREGRMGTFWIYESDREITPADKFE